MKAANVKTGETGWFPSEYVSEKVRAKADCWFPGECVSIIMVNPLLLSDVLVGESITTLNPLLGRLEFHLMLTRVSIKEALYGIEPSMRNGKIWPTRERQHRQYLKISC